MILLPFNKTTFAREMKPKISGNNRTLEYENLESTLSKIAVEFYDYFTQPFYEKIVKKEAAVIPTPAGDYTQEKIDALNALALDYLQRAMLHFCIYQHTIYLIVNIGNDGMTIKKNNDETTLFKYQQDQIENKLIADGWFWLNRLLVLLNENTDAFPDWNNASSDADDVPVKIDDFKKWVGVSDEIFMIFAKWLMREVWYDCVLSRLKPNKIAPVKAEAVRAFCYEVMARACVRLAYHCLPEPVRLDINNEMGKNHAAQADAYIRTKVSETFAAKAESYWNALDAKMVQKAKATDKFYYS
jgi:hypothetical protein